MRVGLAISLLAHVIVLLISGTVRIPPWSEPPSPDPRPAPEGMIVLELDIQPEAAPEETPEEEPVAPDDPAEPEPEPLPEEALEAVPVPEEPRPTVPGELVEEPVEEDPLTAAERLRPRMGDERLWVEFDTPVVAERLERYARADSALRAILHEWLDSLRLSEEERRRARDWTLGGGDQRWGISEEGLHLGDVTIPIPFGQLFQEEGPRGRAAREALRTLQEIRFQDVRRDVEEAMDERREEMRQRSREEAERRQRDTASSNG